MESKAVVNILWIEDNPLLSTEISIKLGDNYYDIPAIKLENKQEFYFRLKILQHPEEIKEFLELCSRIIEDKGILELNKAEGVIPDIVVFDYMLSNNFNGSGSKSIPYESQYKVVRELLNPNYSIVAEYPDVIKQEKLFSENAETYTTTQFITAINNGEKTDVDTELKKLGNDEFGLYAGIAVARFFKNHITCALPATYEKDRTDKLHPTAKYYEWLNKFDLKETLGRENKGSKSWNDILEDGVELLRNRIQSQLLAGKITISLFELLHLVELDFSKSDRIVNIVSQFGKKRLPLDGLFIDKQQEFLIPIPDDIKEVVERAKETGKIDEVKITERDYGIWKFATSLLKTLAKASGIEPNTITQAKSIAEDLWTAATGDILKERFKLSELFAKKYLMKVYLSAEETELLARYCSADFYHVSDCDEIVRQINQSSDEQGKSVKLKAHVNKRIFSIREHHKNSDVDNKIKIVLATLFLAIRLDYHFKDFRRKTSITQKNNSLSSEYIAKPGLKELLYILFPSPKIPILMPGHLQYGGNEFKRKLLDDQFQKFFSRSDSSGINWTTLPDDLDFSNIVTAGEKIICETFATAIGMRKEDYPQWLK